MDPHTTAGTQDQRPSTPFDDTLTPDQESAVQYLTSLLNRTLHITISDQRLFLGTLVCIDKAGNMILNNAEEFRAPLPPDATEEQIVKLQNMEMYWPRPVQRPRTRGGRWMGMVMIPGKHVRTIELESEDGLPAPSDGFT